MRILLVILALGLGAPAVAAPGTVTPRERAVRGLIDEQIAAFRARDAQAAWRLVDPDLQQKFGTADRFLHVVEAGYAPVFSPRSYRYGELIRIDEATHGQWLDVVGDDGTRVKALYLMEQQADGSWRTSGCLLFEPGEAPPVG